MPKKIVRYECLVCHMIYDDEENAIECESRTPAKYPVGLIYGDNTPGAFYEHIVFAVAGNEIHGHINCAPKWACRDMPVGDSIGKETCGDELHIISEESRIDMKMPAFERMVKWLKSQNIPITIWDGENPVSIKEYMERKIAIVKEIK